MIRAQRKAHLRIWVALAVLVPLALALILALSASQVVERAPRLLVPPGGTQGAGG